MKEKTTLLETRKSFEVDLKAFLKDLFDIRFLDKYPDDNYKYQNEQVEAQWTGYLIRCSAEERRETSK